MSDALCPYCRAPLDNDTASLTICPSCGTPHHADCFEENGGCTVFGCTAAPLAEPKVSISTPEVIAGASAPVQPVPRPAPPPPPPLVASATSVPDAPPLFSSIGYNNAPRPITTNVIPRVGVNTFLEPGLESRNRTTFLILGALLGAFGIHSFYAGYVKKGFIQLAITLLTFGFAGLMVWIWAVIDICTITTDRDGMPFRN